MRRKSGNVSEGVPRPFVSVFFFALPLIYFVRARRFSSRTVGEKLEVISNGVCALGWRSSHVRVP